ncbi:hypothetical protein Misp01_51610 [Microtetraspora sp. NBRC 13810]|uniref:Chromate resistance protein ChrB n=1 Tax=Microtetraspora sp. NBRC 13810 TaxID=3030990 RepID=UPI0024A3F6EB|nr:Chromate resistance protein ChrB [Microtetraspora sp. NBRC 13810]GLW10032.1 hypothetical protein Misp01_51610 [Microtetraspora sp. NBRC 13810]
MSPTAREPARKKASVEKGTARKKQARPAVTPAEPRLPGSWLLLTYKVPSEPSRVRVSIWRELKRLGALYLQQAVCVLPDVGTVGEDLLQIRQRIDALDGTSFFFQVPLGDEEQDATLIQSFKEMAGKEYDEIIEECQTKFVKEIEFERFRDNYTFEEAEEIRQDLEKIHRWFGKVVERDWFGAAGRGECEQWLATCETLLEEFENDVYERTSGTGRADVEA